MAIFQVVNEPVSHLVGHHLDQEVEAVLGIEHRIEAQAAAAEVGLAGTLAPQVAPYRRARQRRMHLATEPPGGVHPRVQGSQQRLAVEGREAVGIRGGQRGSFHGVLEWPLARQA